MKNISLALISLLSLSAGKKAEPVKEDAANSPTYEQLEKAQWFIGTWGNTSTEGELTESWRKENDSVFHGESYFVTGGKDTVFAEHVKLQEATGKLSYIVTVPNQNNAEPVQFDATSVTDTQIVFENPKHDYPSKIVYKKVGNDSLVAEIFGIQKGKPASEKFAMKKR